MTANGKWVAYYRVSTDKQGKSGLGLEAQRAAVAAFLNGGDWQMVREFTEVESGKRSDRPQLQAALAACRMYGAKLVIAKLDRLSRNASFLLNLQEAGVEFVCADMPSANKLTIGVMALVAEEERRAISARTKAALQAAKVRGVKLGGHRTDSKGRPVHISLENIAKGREAIARRADAKAADIAPAIRELQHSGAITLRDIATGLNSAGIPTSRGGQWSAIQVKRIIDRMV